MLTAAGDTLFLLISGACSVWFILLIPTYFFIVEPKADIKGAFIIWVVYGLLSSLLVLGRFLQGKWQKKEILEESVVEQIEES